MILDEPKGKNNGWVQGKQYFSCGENYGLFVNPDRISVLEEPAVPAASMKQRPSIAQGTSDSFNGFAMSNLI